MSKGEKYSANLFPSRRGDDPSQQILKIFQKHEIMLILHSSIVIKTKQKGTEG